jgi:L-fuculose-phosphate aldolase
VLSFPLNCRTLPGKIHNQANSQQPGGAVLFEVDIMRLRGDLIEVGKRLDARQLIAGSEGNLSVRLADGTMLITASGTFLGRLGHNDFVKVNIKTGSLLFNRRKPTSELAAHLEVYRHDPSAKAIVHAHPKSCVAITLRGWTLEAIPIPEAAYALGSVPTCDFAVPGSAEGGLVVRQWAGKRDVMLLDRHGAITVGNSPFDALGRMEMLDTVAQSVLLAGGPANMKPLSVDEAERVAAQSIKAGAREESVRAWLDGVKG